MRLAQFKMLGHSQQLISSAAPKSAERFSFYIVLYHTSVVVDSLEDNCGEGALRERRCYDVK